MVHYQDLYRNGALYEMILICTNLLDKENVKSLKNFLMTFIQYPTLNIFKFETNPQDGSLEINSLCSLPADSKNLFVVIVG